MPTGEEYLRRLSIGQGLLVPPDEAAKHFQYCNCADHGPHYHDHDKVESPSYVEMQLASKPHRWPKMRKVQADFFNSLMDAVTEMEIDMLAALKLPSINQVRNSLATGVIPETGEFIFTEAMSKALDRITMEFLVKLMGEDMATSIKQLGSDEMPIIHYHSLEGYTIGLEEYIKLIKKYLPDFMEPKDLKVPLPNIDTLYLDEMITEAGKRIKTRMVGWPAGGRYRISAGRLTELKNILIDMAKNREYPMKTARYLHKYFGEGDAWYWKRIARSEAALAGNAARKELARINKTKYVEWSAGAGACVICSAFDGKRWKLGESPEPISSSHPHCCVFSTLVYTINGWKKIGLIELGDLVLTHAGKFQNVTRLHVHDSYEQKMIRIAYQNEKYSNRHGQSEVSVEFTDNHPFLVNGKWTEAGNIKNGDYIRLLATRCEHCNKLMSFSRWRDFNGIENKYCSASCNTKELQKKYGSEYLLRQFRQNGREMIINKRHHFQTRKRKILSAANSENSRRKYNTKAEQVLNEALAKTGLNYIHQYKINRPEKRACSIGGSMNRFYKADFYLPDHRLAIECDGKQWERDIDYDKDRINYIKSTGIDVLQFSNEFVLNNTDECIKAIQRMAKNHSGQYEFIDVQVSDVKYSIKKNITLYNLSVAEDESYIAKGFVVHNCGCVLIDLFFNEDETMPAWNRDPYENPFRREELDDIERLIRGE